MLISLMLLASANIGYCSRSSVWQFLWIHFKGYGCREFFRSICADGLFFLHPENPEPIYSLYKRLIPLLSTHTLANDLHTSELLGTFLHTIARYQLWCEEKRISAAIEQTIAFIHENYHGNLSVEQLAERENYSVYHFTKLFKKYTGQSPYQYILFTRLCHAQQMLLSTDYTIEEVSRFNNFSSCSRFISIFTKAFGMPPSGTVRILLSRVIQSGDLSLVTGHLFFIGSESYATLDTDERQKSGDSLRLIYICLIIMIYKQTV